MIEQYSNPWFSVIKDGVFHYVIEPSSKNGAVVLVETHDSYIFVIIPRIAHGNEEQIEAPRGYGQDEQSSLETAMRELYEETGYLVGSSQLEKLGTVKPNSAILASEVDVYLAQVNEGQRVKGCDSEVNGIISVAKSDIRGMIARGEITDSFTLSAFALLWSKPSISVDS